MQSRHDIVPCDLIVLFNNKKKISPDFGLLPVNRKEVLIIDEGKKFTVPSESFVDCFRTHCEQTIRSKKNVIVSLHQIKA